jgi:alkylation response protein AidB-like acyl-CoA dehydrogenase
MLITADMGFSLCAMLTYGTVDMLLLHGSDEQKATYLENLVAALVGDDGLSSLRRIRRRGLSTKTVRPDAPGSRADHHHLD